MTVTTMMNEAMTHSAAGTEPNGGIIARATALRPLIREHAAEGHREGRLVPAVIDALAEQGLLSLTVPQRYKGAEANSRTTIDVLAQLAQADGSTGWTAMLLNTANWFATTWPVKAQDEIWGDDPTSRCCVVLAPSAKGRRIEGGYVVSGRWPYASGSYAASHAIMGFLAEREDGGTGQALGILQPGEWTIERSWFPIGMRATGSDTVVAEEVFVPDHRVQFFTDMVEGDYKTELRCSEPRTNAAFLPTGTVIFAGIQIGLGRAALELAVERLKHKGVVGTAYTESRNSPVHQVTVAQATSKVDAAELLAHRSCRDIDEAALRGEYLDTLARARVRNDVGHTVTLVQEAVDALLKAAGSSSFMETNTLARVHQDVGVAGSHVHATPGIANDVYGKLLLGADGPLPVHV
ncbi:acyl-CoA dehydrogenase family protein [Streptomyces sp. SID8352]|uniref:acyl-CoA dehydrogenase family protein n=1 Tax=Streptomyces sp. SID8352 TaxID=2690338 RepID=UPI00136BF3CF|nr:acyl-CoA dehydrogenase family protein [Streptomyces sp. SID8352]MYU21894.1 oxidoreductase [Streptomyces sp. SID8352]